MIYSTTPGHRKIFNFSKEYRKEMVVLTLSILASVLAHLIFILLLTYDFSKETEYLELEVNFPSAIPIVASKPPVKSLPKQVEVNKVNKTVEIIDQKQEEEEEIEEEEKEEIIEISPDTPSETVEDNENLVFVPFYSIDRRPAFLSEAALLYPFKERKQGIEGIVFIEVDIDTKGNLVDYRIIKSGGEGFDKAAIEKIKNSTYSPGYKDGSPVATRMRFTIKFKLDT